jgi:hypothetical protein
MMKSSQVFRPTVLNSLFIALHCTALHCTALHFHALNSLSIAYNGLCVFLPTAYYIVCLDSLNSRCTALHCTSLHCTVLYCTVLCYILKYCTALKFAELRLRILCARETAQTFP